MALTLLNDAAFSELARALANRVLKESSPHHRIDFAFRLCLSRLPAPRERDRILRLVADETRAHGENAAWQTTARVLLNLDETITRE